MKKKIFLTCGLICANAAILALSSTLSAEPSFRVPVGSVVKKQTDYSALLPQPATKTTATTRGMSRAPSEPFKAGAALNHFAFNFQNGDHKIRQISVLQSGSNAEFEFADSNSDDPFGGYAEWYQSNSFISDEVIAHGGGEFDIPIPNPRAGYTPVLKGFMFRRADNTDANIRTIGVRIWPLTNVIRVNLQDDQGLDTRGWEQRIAEGLGIVGIPLGLFAGSYHMYNGGGVIGRVDADINGHRRYDVTVQIAWVPNSMILEQENVSGTQSAIATGRTPQPNEKSVIQGFLFTFDNSDHHLMRFMTSLNPANISAPRHVAFQDGDVDDPKRWFIKYINLR